MDAILEETQWDLFWLPGDVRVVDRPELLFTTGARDPGSMNRVLRVRAAPGREAALVAEVVQAHAGMASCWQLAPGGDSPALRAALRAAGYRPTQRHDGYSLDTAAWRAPVNRALLTRPVADMAGLRDAVAVMERAFGRAWSLSDRDRAAYLEDCTRPGARVHRVVVYSAASGEPLSTGGLTAYPALGFGFLWGGGTAPAGRGRGAYRAALSARVAWALARGLSRVGLYARVDTSGPIVSAKGFTRHGPMTFWTTP